jgi:protein-S-isoprenylcysteine O-methyltransferase Ste14
MTFKYPIVKDGIAAHRVSDWLGFLCFVLLAYSTARKMPAVGLLLIPTLVHELLSAVSFLIRDKPLAAVRSLRARVAAYAGTFLILGFLNVAHQFRPDWVVPTPLRPMAAVGVLLWFNGSLFTIYALWHLRRALSIEPQARRLVMSGPYGFARHPIYTGYFMLYCGMWLLFPTLPFAVVLLVWSLLMRDRIRHEERVLEATFPEYASYRQHVGALGSLSRRAPVRTLRDIHALTARTTSIR